MNLPILKCAFALVLLVQTPSVAIACPDGSSMSYVFHAEPIEAVPRGAVSLKVKNVEESRPIKHKVDTYFTAEVQQVLLGRLEQKYVRIHLPPPTSCGPFAGIINPAGLLHISDPAFVVGYPASGDTNLFSLGYRLVGDRAPGEIAKMNKGYEALYADEARAPAHIGPYILGVVMTLSLSFLLFRMRKLDRFTKARVND